MKAIALLIVLIALAIGTYMNRDESRSAVSEDSVSSGMAAPAKESAPATNEIPL